MTRLVVGPFNRVEGDLELTLDVADGVVAEARVTAPLFRGFEQILKGRPARDALVIAPRICGICSLSQSMAAAAVLRAAQEITPSPTGLLAADLAHAAENVADHLSHFYLFFMPDFCRAEYAAAPWHEAVAARFRAVTGSATEKFLPARTNLLHVVGILAGKWPHSLAVRPGGTTRAIDLGEKMRLLSAIAELRGFLERELFAAPLEAIAELSDPAALELLSENAGDFAAFLRLARSQGLYRLGVGQTPLTSAGAYRDTDPERPLFSAGLFDPTTSETHDVSFDAMTEDTASAWLSAPPVHPSAGETRPDTEKPAAYSWAKAPRLAGRPVEVGAVARQAVDGCPLVRALIARDGGTSVASRVIARLVETARVTLAMERWARALDLSAPFCVADVPERDGPVAGLVEAARGTLGHWVTIRDGTIARYQIVAPTTWNFSPRDAAGIPGPLEQTLVGTPVGDLGARAPAIQHVVRSFDPCMVCTAH
ncbi:Uptake hydrogenase large subunit [Rhodovulum sp. PH10]|uniref:nickel-dependent hydrogenase large subunit n=1 Tax=Rhodovulum sp. PH10 TaxID=1187851 RepID=UPI00027C1E5A|nr:nickel-dependent hydrogenase large subunit [Rhodovulum sp. PH10]EJW11478.1 Uptake hydrogenase large subunit [Rhodovulum sp. PH10]